MKKTMKSQSQANSGCGGGGPYDNYAYASSLYSIPAQVQQEAPDLVS